MTERKPVGMDQVSWVDQQVAAAMARGEFDDIPGQGRPIEDLDKPYDEVWFMRKLRDEGFDTEAMMPASLRLRKQLERLPDLILELRSEDEVRRAVAQLNERIEQYLRMPSGPPVAVRMVDPDRAVGEWRERTGHPERSAPAVPDGVPVDPRHADSAPAAARRPWWRRVIGSRG